MRERGWEQQASTWVDVLLDPIVSGAGKGRFFFSTLSTVAPHLQVAAAEEHARKGWEAAARIPELEGQAGEVPLYCEKLKEAAAVRTAAFGHGAGACVLRKVRVVVTCWLCCCNCRCCSACCLIKHRQCSSHHPTCLTTVSRMAMPAGVMCAVAVAAAVCLAFWHPG